MHTTNNVTQVRQPSLFRKAIDFFYQIYNTYVYKPYLTLKSYYFYYRHINSPQFIPIERIYQDTQKFDQDSFKKNSFAMFCRIMYYLRHRYDNDEYCIKTLKLMCEKGLDVNQVHPNLEGTLYHDNTELMSTISYGRDVRQEPALILLRNFSADPFIPDNFGKNALHFSLLKGHDVQRCIVEEILKHKNIQDHINDKIKSGDTALHIACARRDEKFITKLLEKRANLEIENKDGQKPIDLLHLNEQERLKFLSSCINLRPQVQESDSIGYYTVPADKFEDVATIDQKIFNSDPSAIAAKINKMNKIVAKEKSKDTVLQNSTISQAIERGGLRQR